MNRFPAYSDLMKRSDGPAGSSWGIFGPEDQIGTLNFAGTKEAVSAAGCVRTGKVLTLDYPLDAFNPPLAPTRAAPAHRIFSRHPDHRDDVVESLYPQASTQIDGLRHRRHHDHGFYNNVPDDDIREGSAALGIQLWAERGIVTRGYLLDVHASREASGHGIEHGQGEHLGVDDLEAAVSRQLEKPAKGDILLLHTGWAHWYLSSTHERQQAIRDARKYTGIDQDRSLIEWLWDHQFAAAVSDTYAFEALPARPDSPFGQSGDHGMMHQELIAMLGLAIGELWRLSPLAGELAEANRSTCMIVAKPLNLLGGVGSPANATAIL